ncbi:sensor domain-containing phosphodiesterase [Deinococcus pimensis]|uniref:sensor domain-containing phosphodiesterase n=1 Tax=Deinococcus pimensis TaxID=309888 RepID=UPI0004800A8B|nr:EAL domain-containing protein [Deinococcus pimensis]
MPDKHGPRDPGERAANRELQRLEALRALTVPSTNTNAVLDAVTRSLGRLTGAPIALIGLLDEHTQQLVSTSGIPEGVTAVPRDHTFCQHLLDHDADAPLVILDATLDARFADNPFVQNHPHLRFYAGVPLTTPDGHRVGSLCLHDTAPRTDFTAEETAVLHDLAAVATHELLRLRDDAERVRLTRELIDRKATLRLALEGAGMATWALDLDEARLVIETHGQTHLWPASETLPLARFLSWVAPGDRARLTELLTETRASDEADAAFALTLLVQSPAGRTLHVAVRGRRHPDGTRLVGVAFDVTGQHVTLGTLRDRDEMLRRVLEGVQDAVFLKDATGTFVFANDATARLFRRPLGEVLGRTNWELLDLDVARAFEEATARSLRGGEALTVDEQIVVEGASRNLRTTLTPFALPSGGTGTLGVSRDVTDELRLERALRRNNEVLARQVQERTRKLQRLVEQTQHDAFHDALTGLANRALLLDRLGHSVKLHRDRASHRFAVLKLNVARFRSFVETYGRADGDALLLQVAHRLKTVAAASHTVARVGGDQFVLVAEDLCGPEEVRSYARRVLEALTRPYRQGGREVRVDVRMGVTVCLHEYARAEEALADAALALRAARSDPGSSVVFFEPSMRGEADEDAQVRRDVLAALGRREFEVFFQPIVATGTGEVLAFEALARWRHPSRGVLSPDVFLPVLREERCLADLDRLVLEEACRHASRWPAAGRGGVAPRLSVNCSEEALCSDGFVDFVRTLLGRFGLPPQRVWLEVVEEVLGRDEVTLAVTRELHALGVEVVLDDFGAGYSSLSRLSRLPVSRVKVDRSFLLDLGRGDEGEEGHKVLRAVVELCRSLAFPVVVEGVETRANLEVVEALGVEAWQGFWRSKPVPARYVGRLLKTTGKGMAVRASD